MTKRTLNLKRETLTELAADELQAVIGADAGNAATTPAGECVRTILSQHLQTCRCASGNC